MTEPIRPDDVSSGKPYMLPDPVIAIINGFIVKEWNGSHATFLQEEIVKAISSAMNVSEGDVFKNRWLCFEPIYEAIGWKVEYDKPGYNESYPASFTFIRKEDSRGRR